MGIPQKDITGNKYGLLTAISWEKTEKYITKKSNRTVYHNYWKFRCECGKENVIRKGRVTSGKSAIRSCGCLRGKNNWRGFELISGTYWGQVKKGAEKRGLEMTVTIEDAWKQYEKQNGHCALSGVEIGFGEDQTASLDRIDSALGYTKSNVQWLHRDVNCMKWDLNQDKLVEWCELICKHKGD